WASARPPTTSSRRPGSTGSCSRRPRRRSRRRGMDTEAAAGRWVTTWERAGAANDVEPIVALYDDSVPYRALAFRAPDLGIAGVRRYLDENFGVEEKVECRFGEPIVQGDRAAVEWWASWVEEG